MTSILGEIQKLTAFKLELLQKVKFPSEWNDHSVSNLREHTEMTGNKVCRIPVFVL